MKLSKDPWKFPIVFGAELGAESQLRLRCDCCERLKLWLVQVTPGEWASHCLCEDCLRFCLEKLTA